MKIELVLCIWLIGVPAWSQTEHGTIVVAFGLTQGHIALAADSMATLSNGDQGRVCKITTIDNKLIAAVTGIAGHVAEGKWDFSALASAHAVSARFTTREKKGNNFASLFVKAWAVELVHKFNHELRVRPSETVPASGDPLLANGIVIGLDEKRELGIWAIHLKYRTLANGRKIAYSEPEQRCAGSA
jgi:20S proteasome alpha/beta subunit